MLVTNPFNEEAVVNVRVLGDKGDQIPSGLSNLQIPQLSQTVLFLGDFVPATPSFGLDVTASRGRVVVARLMRVAARDGVRGLSFDVGATAPSIRWLLPGGDVPTSGEEDIVVANPSDHEALVSTVFQVESGTGPAGSQDVPIPAGGQKTLKVSDQVPGGTRHATILSSTNGVPVVAERLTVGPQGAYQTVLGAPDTAASWVVAAGSAAGGTDSLALVADGPDKAICKITVLSGSGPVSPAPLAAAEIVPGQRTSIDLTPYLNGQPALVLVEATTGKVARRERSDPAGDVPGDDGVRRNSARVAPAANFEHLTALYAVRCSKLFRIMLWSVGLRWLREAAWSYQPRSNAQVGLTDDAIWWQLKECRLVEVLPGVPRRRSTPVLGAGPDGALPVGRPRHCGLP